MDEPDTRIVQLESKSKVAASVQECSIASSRVVVLIGWYGAIPTLVDLRENHKVVAVQMDRMRSRDVLLSRDVEDVVACDDKVHKAVVPLMVRVVDDRLERICQLRFVVKVQDAWLGLVQKQRLVFELPSKCTMRRDIVEVCLEGEWLSVVLEGGYIPWHNWSKALDWFVLASFSIRVRGSSRTSSACRIVADDAGLFFVLSDSTAIQRDACAHPVVTVR